MTRRINLLVFILLLANAMFAVAASDVPRMSTEELNGRLGESGLVIVDSRTGADWSGSDKMIAGAMRGNPSDIAVWLSGLNKDQVIVLYCS